MPQIALFGRAVVADGRWMWLYVYFSALFPVFLGSGVFLAPVFLIEGRWLGRDGTES